MRHLRQAQRHDCQVVQKLDQISNESDGTGISACYLSSLLATQLINNMTANDNLFTVTLPTQDAPEDYWVQQVIITFQQAVTVGGTEFYPFCTRMRNGLAQPNHVHS